MTLSEFKDFSETDCGDFKYKLRWYRARLEGDLYAQEMIDDLIAAVDQCVVLVGETLGVE